MDFTINGEISERGDNIHVSLRPPLEYFDEWQFGQDMANTLVLPAYPIPRNILEAVRMTEELERSGKLSRSAESVDLAVNVNGDVIRCKRYVLTKISPVFKRLAQDFELDNKTVVLDFSEEIPSSTFSSILDTVYLRHFWIEDLVYEDLLALFKMAALLQISQLTLVCGNWLKRFLVMLGSCVDLMVISRRFKMRTLHAAAIALFAAKFQWMIENNRTEHVDINDWRDALTNPALHLVEDTPLLRALCIWFTFRPEERARHVPELASMVNFTRVNNRYKWQLIDADPDVIWSFDVSGSLLRYLEASLYRIFNAKYVFEDDPHDDQGVLSMFSWLHPCVREDRKVVVAIGGVDAAEFATVRVQNPDTKTSHVSPRDHAAVATSPVSPKDAVTSATSQVSAVTCLVSSQNVATSATSPVSPRDVATEGRSSKKRQKKKSKKLKTVDTPAEKREDNSCSLQTASLIMNTDRPTQRVLCWEMGVSSSAVKTVYALPPVPFRLGKSFASCTWRNCLYVSGGEDNPHGFGVFRPWQSEWTDFGDVLPEGRCSHCMAALDNKVFILGGLRKGARRGSLKVARSILVYEIPWVGQAGPVLWTGFGQLAEAVYKAVVTVRGHRIYVVGGIKEDGSCSRLIQCVDVYTGTTYLAGNFPFECTTDSVSVTSYGCSTCFISCNGVIYRMSEFTDKAEHVETTSLPSREVTTRRKIPESLVPESQERIEEKNDIAENKFQNQPQKEKVLQQKREDLHSPDNEQLARSKDHTDCSGQTQTNISNEIRKITQTAMDKNHKSFPRETDKQLMSKPSARCLQWPPEESQTLGNQNVPFEVVPWGYYIRPKHAVRHTEASAVQIQMTDLSKKRRLVSWAREITEYQQNSIIAQSYSEKQNVLDFQTTLVDTVSSDKLVTCKDTSVEPTSPTAANHSVHTEQSSAITSQEKVCGNNPNCRTTLEYRACQNVRETESGVRRSQSISSHKEVSQLTEVPPLNAPKGAEKHNEAFEEPTEVYKQQKEVSEGQKEISEEQKEVYEELKEIYEEQKEVSEELKEIYEELKEIYEEQKEVYEEQKEVSEEQKEAFDFTTLLSTCFRPADLTGTFLSNPEYLEDDAAFALPLNPAAILDMTNLNNVFIIQGKNPAVISSEELMWMIESKNVPSVHLTLSAPSVSLREEVTGQILQASVFQVLSLADASCLCPVFWIKQCGAPVYMALLSYPRWTNTTLDMALDVYDVAHELFQLNVHETSSLNEHAVLELKESEAIASVRGTPLSSVDTVPELIAGSICEARGKNSPVPELVNEKELLFRTDNQSKSSEECLTSERGPRADWDGDNPCEFEKTASAVRPDHATCGDLREDETMEQKKNLSSVDLSDTSRECAITHASESHNTPGFSEGQSQRYSQASQLESGLPVPFKQSQSSCSPFQKDERHPQQQTDQEWQTSTRHKTGGTETLSVLRDSTHLSKKTETDQRATLDTVHTQAKNDDRVAMDTAHTETDTDQQVVMDTVDINSVCYTSTEMTKGGFCATVQDRNIIVFSDHTVSTFLDSLVAVEKKMSAKIDCGLVGCHLHSLVVPERFLYPDHHRPQGRIRGCFFLTWRTCGFPAAHVLIRGHTWEVDVKCEKPDDLTVSVMYDKHLSSAVSRETHCRLEITAQDKKKSPSNFVRGDQFFGEFHDKQRVLSWSRVISVKKLYDGGFVKDDPDQSVHIVVTITPGVTLDT